MPNEQDESVKRALAKAMGCDISKVRDFGTKKKKKKKIKKKKNVLTNNIISSGEGLEITSSGTQYLDFNDLPKTNFYNKEIGHVFNWDKPRDFVIFTTNLHRDKFNKTIELRLSSSCNEMNKIRDDLYDLTGISSSLVVRDYIVFCFDRFIPSLLKKRGKSSKFYFGDLRNKFFMNKFVDSYDYKSSLDKEYKKLMTKKENKKEEGKVVQNVITNNEIEEIYLLSDIGFVCNCGIVVAINWLIEVKKVGVDKSVKMVKNICKKIIADKLFKTVKKSTKKLSPYPESFVFNKEQLDVFLKEMDMEIDVNFLTDKETEFKFNFIGGKSEKT
jgi:hypothetical protein